MLRRPSAGARTPVDGPQPHGAHKPLQPLPASQADPARPSSVWTPKRGLQVLPVDLAHQGQILCRGSLGQVVEAGTADPQQGALPHQGKGLDAAGPPSAAVWPDSWTDLCAKKSRSTLSCQLLLVQAGDQGGVVPGLLLLVVAEDTGGALRKCLLPGLNLPRMDSYRAASWATVSWPFSASSATLAFKAGLCFLRPCDISCSLRQQPLKCLQKRR